MDTRSYTFLWLQVVLTDLKIWIPKVSKPCQTRCVHDEESITTSKLGQDTQLETLTDNANVKRPRAIKALKTSTEILSSVELVYKTTEGLHLVEMLWIFL